MRILKKARVLNKVLGEEVVSCDLEALYVAPGVGYVAEMMERRTMEKVTVDERVQEEEKLAGEGEKDPEKAEVCVGVDVDVDDDGEDTPKPGSSPSSKNAPSEGAQGSGSPSSPDGGPSPQPDAAKGGEQKEEAREENPQILCTTQLGLVRAEKIPRTRGEWEEVVLVKPVVVLVQEAN